MFGQLAKLLGRAVQEGGKALNGTAHAAGAPVDNTPIPSPMGKRYIANPQSSEFVGPNAVDPKVFGYGPDGPISETPNVRDIPDLRKYNFYPKVILPQDQPQQNQGQYSLQEELKNSFYPKVRY